MPACTRAYSNPAYDNLVAATVTHAAVAVAATFAAVARTPLAFAIWQMRQAGIWI